MAVITPTFPTKEVEEIDVLWETLTSTNTTGRPVSLAKYNDKHISIYGTFDTTTIVLQGTDDPRGDPDHADHSNAVWFTLPDPQGNAISLTANGADQILSNPKWIRPNATIAGASTDLDVAITAIRRYF